jgi:hypothetical protein
VGETMILYAVSFKGSDKKTKYWIFDNKELDQEPLSETLTTGCLVSKDVANGFVKRPGVDPRYKVAKFKLTKVTEKKSRFWE